jgi:hypothetical protein
METTEKIVEAYLRYVRNCATLPNIRCSGQNEIDLLGIDLVQGTRYHVECSVSVSHAFSKLTARDFDPNLLNVKVSKPKMRRTIGYFVEYKFGATGVVEKLKELGFLPGEHQRVIVTWDWNDDAATIAKEHSILLWPFPALLRELTKSVEGTNHYFVDDTIHTLHLMGMANSGKQSRPMPVESTDVVRSLQTSQFGR